MLFLCLFFF